MYIPEGGTVRVSAALLPQLFEAFECAAVEVGRGASVRVGTHSHVPLARVAAVTAVVAAILQK